MTISIPVGAVWRLLRQHCLSSEVAAVATVKCMAGRYSDGFYRYSGRDLHMAMA